MNVVLTATDRELINEAANGTARHSDTRTMVCGDLDGVEKWFSDGNQEFVISEELVVRVQNIFDECEYKFEVVQDEEFYLP